MTLPPGWLERQIKDTNDDIATWPAWMRREAGFMTHLEKMDRLIPITFRDGDWCVIQGLLTGEWSKVRKEGTRPEYLATLSRMREEITRKTE